ncbi:putative oxidoreductase YfjR [Psilocybe cubensis]|uniref:Oxidoreductase YfjR n=2 Tax=Psilocybe cubensis TaxID=181762 RepID=A0ACB8HFP1_PSICU|nr:putative oxidoreductase YfjR [Psilocybe cubensis]KAH9486311.1 putative oxidoreductase YfjR [Psilocybe cubensis]
MQQDTLTPENPTPPYTSRPHTPKLFPPQIGCIGLGNIGFLMTRNLALNAPTDDGPLPPIMIWNRTVSKAEKLIELVGDQKCRIAKDPEEIAKECDIIFVNLANDDVVRSIYNRLTSSLRRNPPTREKIFVETSTLTQHVAELDSMLSNFPRVHLISCPVIGSPIVAEKSQLLLVMSGDYRSKKEVAYWLVPAVGKRVIDLGGDLQKALTFKLLANSLILGNLEILAEAFTFAQKSGIGENHVDALIKEYFPAPSIVNYAEKMMNDSFDGSQGFSIDGGIKDATHIRRLTAKHNSPMPAIDVAHQNLLTARAHFRRMQQQGHSPYEELDWSGLIAGTRVSAGLYPFDQRKDFGLTMVKEQN